MLGLNRQTLARLRDQIPGFVTVENASYIAPINNIGELLPACILSPGPSELMPGNADQIIGLEDQEWDVLVIVAYGHSEEEQGLTELNASRFMNAVYNALHGWKCTNGLQRQGFVYKGRYEPIYHLGWAIFPMSFSAMAVIGRDAEQTTT